MNPRYLAYCKAHFKTPDEMMTRDHVDYPGGLMTGFILWVNAQWNAWATITKADLNFLSERDHKDFSAWLTARN